MSKYEGILLSLETVDKCNRKFSKDCEITFPKKIPVTLAFLSGLENILGYSEINRDDNGLSCKVTLYHETFNDDSYYVGGYYNKVETHKEGDITVIDSCNLISMGIVPNEGSCCDENIIYKVEED